MNDERKWVCGVCGAYFDLHDQLHDHIHSKHQAELRELEDAKTRYLANGNPMELELLRLKIGAEKLKKDLG